MLWNQLDEYQQKYLGEVRYTDFLLGKIFDELKNKVFLIILGL
ncbi:hypothetical protein LEP1GSC151_5098 [Leptospira interrogans serovar Grippotyphosa str. LT2186]|uniref:Uncharacterized protein n=1 Tax=Leptospira interrogans serovar Grippotyphosa str. LT2186 TaxID=1001599 RepID=M3GQ59_LEPIR|nr:hypothetical protein LEP1GSC151_5098 [Leptospira interrogans serovar Grippotyphosa str. LT2186]